MNKVNGFSNLKRTNHPCIWVKLLTVFLAFASIILESSCSMAKTQPISASHYSPAWPHGKIQEIFPNIFLVTGTNKTRDGATEIQTSRNMVIVRENGILTLINTVRLNEEGLKSLDSLGKVSNIVKIGPFHGRDDAFYLDRYHAKFWALKGMHHENDRTADVEMVPDGTMPFQKSSLFLFETAKQPEGIIYLSRQGGMLITCDSIKNWTHVDKFFSKETGDLFSSTGSIKPANIDDIWINALSIQPSDFIRFKSLPFHHLISAHGEPLIDNAKKLINETLQRKFGI